ncbi:MAG TPA: hypothetical protein VFT72_06890 [Opitutaceae bacterium]|nr:hypothetical protein [Opitutaceae bacterium]
MSAVFPPCPHLPPPLPQMDWRNFNQHGREDRGDAFYLTALRYGNSLWQRGFAARSILCLDRAFGADLRGTESVLAEWPLPYAAMAWILAETPAGVFIGNPRVHFQHYADRLKAPRKDQRKWRAWACWAIARAVLPNLPADPRHEVEEPSLDEIEQHLRLHGHPGEAELWRSTLR